MIQVRFIDGPHKGHIESFDMDALRLGTTVKVPVGYPESHLGWRWEDYIVTGQVGDQMLAKVCQK